MATVKLGPTINADAQRYPALADMGVPEDGLITKEGVEIEDAEVLAFIGAKCKGVEVKDGKDAKDTKDATTKAK